MSNYEDLYVFLKKSFGNDIIINLDVMEYLDDIEINGKYKGIPILFRDLFTDDLVMEYDGDERTLEFEIIPVVSEFIGELPAYRFDAVDFETLNKKYTSVTWSKKKDELRELQRNPIVNQTTIAKNIVEYEKSNKLVKKRLNER